MPIEATPQQAPVAPDWALQLTQLPAVRLRCLVKTLDGTPLPGPGAFRGAIGHLLKEGGDQAAFATFFPSERDPKMAARMGAATPWAMHLSVDGHLEIGLFADALPHIGALVGALSSSIDGRLGKSRAVRLGPMQHEPVLSSDDWQPGLPRECSRWSVPVCPAKGVLVELQSPLRLRRDGKDVTPALFSPRDLLAQLMRRLSNLCEQAALAAPEWNARELLDGIGGTHWRQPDFRRTVTSRYSQPQQSQMAWAGILGSGYLDAAAIALLWPVLWMGQALHAGKTPCIGMGRYRVLQHF